MNDDIQKQFRELVEIMSRLRRACPWDREQTAESLRKYVIEEAYEVVEAIDRANPDDLKEELGDLMLQVVFQAEIGRERGEFDIGDVLRKINEKLVRRHPHVFGDVNVSDADEVLQNWEQIKLEEKAGSARLEGVPRSLPALLRAYRIISKCERASLDLVAPDAAAEELSNLVRDLLECRQSSGGDAVEYLVARILFIVSAVAKGMGVSAEDALREFEDRIVDRLHAFEARLGGEGRPLGALSQAERCKLAEELTAPPGSAWRRQTGA